MTAQLDNTVTSGSAVAPGNIGPRVGPVPGRFPVSAPALFGLIGWVIYFTSLSSVYLVAFNRHNLACERSAALGLGISLGSALLAFPAGLSFALFSPHSRRPSRLPAFIRISELLFGCLLAAASVVVIWVAINLTLASQSTGAWILTIPAALAPLAWLIGSRGWIQDEELTGPSTEIVPAPPSAGPAEAPEPAVPTDETEATGDQAAAVAVLDVTSAPVLEKVSVLERAPDLVNPDWPERLGDSSVAVALDSGFWQAAIACLARMPTEQGGVALVIRLDSALAILAMIFPAQIKASAVRCEFSTSDVERIRMAMDAVFEEPGDGTSLIKMTWVHTHPRLGVFLSGTDQETARQWRELDPDFTPIVIDPSRGKLDEQIGVYDANGRRIKPVRIVEELINKTVTNRLKVELLRAYRADGLPDPLVFMSGA